MIYKLKYVLVYLIYFIFFITENSRQNESSGEMCLMRIFLLKIISTINKKQEAVTQYAEDMVIDEV